MLTEDQKKDNEASSACPRADEGRWVDCDHAHCWDPDECSDQDYVSENNCQMQAVHAKLDVCSCGKKFHYP